METGPMAKDMSNDAGQSILKLHSRRELAGDGRPAMTRTMLRLIGGAERDETDAGNGDDRECDELADLDQEQKAVALARLLVEHPALYGIVYLVDHRGLSLRSVGRHLNLDHHTVGRHRDKGLAYVRDWCSDTRQAS